MKHSIQNKLVAILFALAVLTPLAVQASHALDRHEHIVCTAKDVKHFHADELDCLLCCTTVELTNFISFNTYTGLDIPEIGQSLISFSQLSSLEINPFKASRAPPLRSV